MKNRVTAPTWAEINRDNIKFNLSQLFILNFSMLTISLTYDNVLIVILKKI